MKAHVMAKRIVEQGYSLADVTRMVQARGVMCHPSTISRVLRGSDPSWTLGHAIYKVYVEKCETPEAGK